MDRKQAQVEDHARQKKLEGLLEALDGCNRQFEDMIGVLHTLNINLEGDQPPPSNQVKVIGDGPVVSVGALNQLNNSMSRYSGLLEELREVTAPLVRLA